MGETVTKRLLISGLTTAISSDDLSRRLASFGAVTALDGLGRLDALGQPRNFAHVTLETTKMQLSRCMNVLSGSTWKGAKLRIGEAKPDFRERIQRENAAAAAATADEIRPRKRRRLARGCVQGRHAQDMSLVTPENVHRRPQWRVTPLGRLIRPMRMRPARPLDPPLDAPPPQNLSTGKGKDQGRKRRARAAAPPTRARRQTIDPLRWGSTHLGGVFLCGEPTPALALASALVVSGEVSSAGAAAGADNGESTEVEDILEPSQSPADDTSSESRATASPRRSSSSSIPVQSPITDLAAEKDKALRLLSAMFGDANEDWGGAENVELDMEQDTAAMNTASQSPHDDFALRTDKKSSPVDREAHIATAQQPSTKLKDLFAPREEEAFSLIGHLNLDSELELELDLDEPAFANNAPAPAPVPSVPNPTSSSNPAAIRRAAATPAHTRQHSKALDETLPFFFSPRDLHQRKKKKFVRTEDEAEIRARWEAARGDLTREWKRRHREAVKSRRRRGAGERIE